MADPQKPTRIVNVFDVLRKVSEGVPSANDSVVDTCAQHIGDMMRGAMKREQWALMMVDATAKLPEPLLGGLNLHLGDYDQCLRARSDTFAGRYCLVSAMDQRIATCVPSTCNAMSLSALLGKLSDGLITVPNTTCEAADDPYVFHPATAVLGVVFILSIISALGWFSLTYENVRTKLPEWCRPSAAAARRMSPVTAWNKITQRSKPGVPNPVSCTSGIRTLSIMWVVMGHREALMASLPVLDKHYLPERMQQWAHVYVPAGLFAVDTFLVVAGCLLGFSFASGEHKHPKRGNISIWIGLYALHRYIRITPILAFTVLFYAGGLLYMGEGPLWLKASEFDVNSCRTNWWPNLIYIHNYYNNRNMCVGHSWYLAVDMQLYLFSPLLLFPVWYLWRPAFTSPGRWIYAAFVAASIAIPFTIAAVYNVPPAPDPLGDPMEYLLHVEKVYIPAHTRAAPYFIGVGVGLLIASDYVVDSFARVKEGFLWLCVFLGLILLPFGMTSTFRSEDVISRWTSASFISMSRALWGLGVSALIFLCADGRARRIDAFLSWYPLVVLSRLSFAVYLLHPTIQGMTGWTTRGTTVATDLVVLPLVIADIVLSFAVALPISLLFESPFMAAEAVLLQKYGGRITTSGAPSAPRRIGPRLRVPPKAVSPSDEHQLSINMDPQGSSPKDEDSIVPDVERGQKQGEQKEEQQQQQQRQEDNEALSATSTTNLNVMSWCKSKLQPLRGNRSRERNRGRPAKFSPLRTSEGELPSDPASQVPLTEATSSLESLSEPTSPVPGPSTSGPREPEELSESESSGETKQNVAAFTGHKSDSRDHGDNDDVPPQSSPKEEIPTLRTWNVALDSEPSWRSAMHSPARSSMRSTRESARPSLRPSLSGPASPPLPVPTPAPTSAAESAPQSSDDVKLPKTPLSR